MCVYVCMFLTISNFEVLDRFLRNLARTFIAAILGQQNTVVFIVTESAIIRWRICEIIRGGDSIIALHVLLLK